MIGCSERSVIPEGVNQYSTVCQKFYTAYYYYYYYYCYYYYCYSLEQSPS